MAVAVKTSPGARSSGSPGGLALLSLVGVVYLLATIAIVFKLLPSLWWSAWEGLGWGQSSFVGGTLLAILEVAGAIALLWGGARLLGTHPPAGVRAGVFVGFVGLLLVLLLTRWAGRIFEDYAFYSRSLTPQLGGILTGVTGALLLAIWLYAFTRAKTLGFLVRLEEAGWFHATTYKGNQGRLVRRGTIIGLLLLAGTGIWSLMHGGALRRGPVDYVLTIPFTGHVAVDWMGDARPFVKEVPAAAKNHVEIKWPGVERDSNLRVDQVVSVEQYKAAVQAALDRAEAQTKKRLEKTRDDLREIEVGGNANQNANRLVQLKRDEARQERELRGIDDAREHVKAAADGDVTDYLLAVNEAVHAEFRALVPKPDQTTFKALPDDAGFHEDSRRRLYEVDRQTHWDDLTKLLAAIKKEAENNKRTDELGWVLLIPQAIPVIDRAALLTANEQTDKKVNVIVGVKRNAEFGVHDGKDLMPEGKVVPTKEFEAEEVRTYLGVAEKVLDRDSPNEKNELEKLGAADNGEDFRKKLNERIEVTGNEQLKIKLQAIREQIASADDVPERSIPLLVPKRESLSPAMGKVLYAEIPLLPSVQFTLPLLLLAASIWLAWRIVNLPMFADFLIATEAELNKVSWTTQKRLVQDTIVVLVTVVMMALFLFSMDVMWKKVLSWKHIGVLYIPEDKEEKKKLEEKKW